MFWFPERWSTITAATAAGSNGATNGSTDSAQEAISTYMKDKVCATAIACVCIKFHIYCVGRCSGCFQSCDSADQSSGRSSNSKGRRAVTQRLSSF
jgi:hypothetical protein